MNNYDQNRDGRLDYGEFLSYILDRERKWKINFHALDKNKCGEFQRNNVSLMTKTREAQYICVIHEVIAYISVLSRSG